MRSIVVGNNYPYFKDFNYYEMFTENLDKVLERKLSFFKKRYILSEFAVENSYQGFPFFMLANDQICWFEELNPLFKDEFISILKKIEDDLDIIINFGVMTKSYNKSLLSHNHIGYNRPLDRNLYTLKYILEFTGDKSAYFFCENDYIKFNKNHNHKWYTFKTFRSHMYLSNDKSDKVNYRYEFAFNFMKKNYLLKNKDKYFSLSNNLPSTNFNLQVSADVCVRLSPAYFMFKKNKRKIIL